MNFFLRRISRPRCSPWLWAVLLLLAMFASLPGFAQAQAAILSLESYWNQVEETRLIVRGAQDLSPDSAHALLVPQAERWEAVRKVSLPDGSLLEIDASFLAAQLRANPPELHRLEGLLDTLLAVKEASPSAVFTDRDVRTVQNVLARPEFQWQQAEPSLLEQWRQRIWERFLQWLARVLKSLGGSGVLSATPYLVAAGGLLLIFLALIYLLRGVVAGMVAESELGAGEGSEEDHLTAESALLKAQSLSSAGDYRAAVRLLYISALLRLEERGILPYDRSRTNREYLRSLAHLPALAVTLRDVVEVFDRVWYGFQPLDEAGYTRYARQVEDLQQQK